MSGVVTPLPLGGDSGATGTDGQGGGRRRRGASVKTLKRMLKKAGLKTTGRKAALTRRAKKAHLKMRGGDECPQGQHKDAEGDCVDDAMGGKKKSRRSRGFKLY
jgi:hypothetical protein